MDLNIGYYAGGECDRKYTRSGVGITDVMRCDATGGNGYEVSEVRLRSKRKLSIGCNGTRRSGLFTSTSNRTTSSATH